MNCLQIIMKNGYAFVEFVDYRDADDAVHDLNGQDLQGERCVVVTVRYLYAIILQYNLVCRCS